jgi:hypothetical protein
VKTLNLTFRELFQELPNIHLSRDIKGVLDIKVDLLEIILHNVELIGLAQDKENWRDLVNAVMIPRVS